MKSKFITFLLFIIMIFLIAVIGVFGFLIYTNLTEENIWDTIDASDTLVSFDNGEGVEETTVSNKGIKNVLTEIFTSSSSSNEEEYITYSAEASNGKFYYEQLNDNQKILYNGLLENKENMLTGTYVIQFGNQFSHILEQEDGAQILKRDYQTAIEAYMHDNPDIFYLNVEKLYLNIETSKSVLKTTYNTYISPDDGETYFDEKFKTEQEIRTVLSQIEKERDNILSKLTNDEYKNIKIIHDYLIDNIEYDTDYESKGTYSIYGAFIDKKCVCEGYAKAFKYLTNSIGIDCELVQGTATNSSGKTENHAWNCVLLDGKWYYIDVTWDDPIIIGNGFVSASVNYKYFLKGEKTFSEDHVLEMTFSEGGKEFSYPIISSTDY